ncbi:S-adenosylmethionine-dependent methyltransferase [Lecanora helva]
MLPTPSTSHVDLNRIYEPAEDSYLLLDTLSSVTEREFLTRRFSDKDYVDTPNPPPFIVEVGVGSGIVLAFITAQARAIFGREDIVALGTDVNVFACRAAEETISQACRETNIPKHDANKPPIFSTICADLTTPLRLGVADVLIFNPPYVPSESTPGIRSIDVADDILSHADNFKLSVKSFEQDSYLLSLSYAGGLDGMEVTNRFLEDLPTVLDQHQGVAYILLCQQNKPDEMVQRIRTWGEDWDVKIVGRSGKKAGWEKLFIVRIWRIQRPTIAGQ